MFFIGWVFLYTNFSFKESKFIFLEKIFKHIFGDIIKFIKNETIRFAILESPWDLGIKIAFGAINLRNFARNKTIFENGFQFGVLFVINLMLERILDEHFLYIAIIGLEFEDGKHHKFVASRFFFFLDEMLGDLCLGDQLFAEEATLRIILGYYEIKFGSFNVCDRSGFYQWRKSKVTGDH